MDKEKQIEEMAELERLLRIRRIDIEKQGFDIFALIKRTTSEEQAIAEYLIGHNYRKASDVAREIFWEFRAEMRSLIETSEDLYIKSGDDDYYLGKKDAFFTAILHLDELIKKKYTEGEG